MSYTIDLATNGADLKRAYDAIRSSDPAIQWAVFNYQGQTNALRLAADGQDLDAFVDEFDDGRVQYGFCRLDYNGLPKFALVGWVGEGVPERTKGYFNAHLATVAKYFAGYHVQLTARSASDLSTAIIVDKVHAASGSKYSNSARAIPLRPKYTASKTGASEEDWGGAEPVVESEPTKVQSAYKPTKVTSASLAAPYSSGTAASKPDPAPKLEAPPKPAPLQSSYQPVGKVDIAAIKAQARRDQFSSKPEPLQSSYQPVGKVDIAAIRAQAARGQKSQDEPRAEAVAEVAKPAPRKVDPPAEQVEPSEPKSLADRMKAFGGSSSSVQGRASTFESAGRLTELPKPKVSNSVASRFTPSATRGTAPALPIDSYGATSKAAAGFKNFGTDGGKTPAQLWAEKHGRRPSHQDTNSAQSEPTPNPVYSEPVHDQDQDQDQDQEDERPSISQLRSQFASSTVSAPVPEPSTRPAPPHSSFSDVTAKFAASRAAPEPAAQAAPEPAARPIPAPEPAARPVPTAPEPVEEPDFSEPIMIPKPVARDTAPVAEPSRAQSITAVAQYDYAKDEDNEIDLAEGERVVDIVFEDEEWWSGRNERGQVGLFPAQFVELVQNGAPAAPYAEQPEAEPEAQPEPEPLPEPEAESAPSARAEYDYEAAEEGELSFPENAIITNIAFDDEAWWSGDYNGTRGLFPANYVNLV